ADDVLALRTAPGAPPDRGVRATLEVDAAGAGADHLRVRLQPGQSLGGPGNDGDGDQPRRRRPLGHQHQLPHRLCPGDGLWRLPRHRRLPRDAPADHPPHCPPGHGDSLLLHRARANDGHRDLYHRPSLSTGRGAQGTPVDAPGGPESSGSVWTITSTSCTAPRMASSAAWAISWARSTGTPRGTWRMTSAKVRGPDLRTRTWETPATSGTAAARAIRSSSPTGAVSRRSSTDLRPSRTLTSAATAATPSAATASARASQAMPVRPESHTPASPNNTTVDDQTSVEKWSASASSAWLRCARATRARARERERSTTMEISITPNAQGVASTCPVPRRRRRTAS